MKITVQQFNTSPFQPYNNMSQFDHPAPIDNYDQDTQILPPWNVVLLDDNDHSYDYVIEMLQHIFGYGRTKAYQMAVEVDTTGRVIVWTGPLEHAELKRDQIHAYGADYRIEWSEGSMSAILEEAHG